MRKLTIILLILLVAGSFLPAASAETESAIHPG